MNRFRIRLRPRRLARASAPAGVAGVLAVGLTAATVLAGCGTGQIAQTTDQAPGVNGTEGVIGPVALCDVRIQAVQNGAFVQPGHSVDLLFVASNESLDTDDELTGISSGIGVVSLTGARKLPAGGVLIVDTPAGQNLTAPTAVKELRTVEDANMASATVALDKPISNGLTYGFTFEFKQAGRISLAVPISAGVLTEATSAQPQR